MQVANTMKNVPIFASNIKLTCLVTPSPFSGGSEKFKKSARVPHETFYLGKG